MSDADPRARIANALAGLIGGGYPRGSNSSGLGFADMLNYMAKDPEKSGANYFIANPLGNAGPIQPQQRYSVPMPVPDPRGSHFNERLPAKNEEEQAPYVAADSFMRKLGTTTIDNVVSPDDIMRLYLYGARDVKI